MANHLVDLLLDLTISDSYDIETEESLEIADDESHHSEEIQAISDEFISDTECGKYSLEYMKKVVDYARPGISFTTIQHAFLRVKDRKQLQRFRDYNSDSNKQRPIKRVQLETDRNNEQLREERFSLPVLLASGLSVKENCSGRLRDDVNEGRFADAYYALILRGFRNTMAYVVKEATKGIIQEGTKLGKVHEAEWLAKQLREVEHLRQDVPLFLRYPSEIGDTLNYLYTKESFWYKLINRVLRNLDTVTLEQVGTLGPFCYLLHNYFQHIPRKDIFTVYRGLTLTDEQREDFMKEKLTFTSFTSTSKNREKAEQFGDTLLIMDLNVKHSQYDRNFL
ncbi:unnamed protein product, partial [Rotaria sp. Silwood1]